MIRFIKLLPTLLVAAVTTQMIGCAQLQMTPPKASIENTQKARASGIAPAAVGNFVIDPSKDAKLDTGVALRGGNSVSSPIQGSFALYLKESLSAELQAAGLLDNASKTVVSGFLTDSTVETFGTGKGTLGARFVVTRDGVSRYNRELKVDSTWETSFIAGIAVPAAAVGYEGLYRKMVGALLDDADFKKALAR